MTKNTAPKAPAKPRAKAPTPEVADTPVDRTPKLVLSLHDQIDWNDVGFRFGDDA